MGQRLAGILIEIGGYDDPAALLHEVFFCCPDAAAGADLAEDVGRLGLRVRTLPSLPVTLPGVGEDFEPPGCWWELSIVVPSTVWRYGEAQAELEALADRRGCEWLVSETAVLALPSSA